MTPIIIQAACNYTFNQKQIIQTIKARLVDKKLFKQTANKNTFGQKKFHSTLLYPFYTKIILR